MPQYAVPTGDVDKGTWRANDDIADLYLQINGGILQGNPVNDGTYIKQPSGLPSTGIVALASLTDPIVHTGHYIGFRARVNTGSLAVNVVLYQGSTAQVFNSGLTLSTTFTNYSGEIPSGNIANITDYSDLRVRFIAPGLSPEPQFSEFELQIPDAPITDSPNTFPAAYLIFV